VSGLLSAAWPPPRVSDRRDLGDATIELGFRSAALRVGFQLGCASIVAVLAGLGLDGSARHRWLLLGLTLGAATANAAATVVPWRDWLATRRGRILLDLWCGGLIAFVALLVVDGGPNFALLLFLAIPFIAVVQIGWRRGFWLGVSGGTCAVAAAVIPLSAAATAMRLALIAAVAGVALLVARALRREAARAELERTLAQEANHRIKNDLQTVADLLLLGRPAGEDGTAFDETAARIRSIATVHRLLTETEHRVDASALLHCIAETAPVPVEVDAQPAALDARTAQKLGIVANELVMNAFRHGTSPIAVRLIRGTATRLCVTNGGGGVEGPAGLGLELVRRMVEQGLGGTFELSDLPDGGTRAEVVFPTVAR
jgi:two-component sensor histidine kinase